LTASWNIVGIQAHMMSRLSRFIHSLCQHLYGLLAIWKKNLYGLLQLTLLIFCDPRISTGIRRKKRSQSTNQKEHLLMPNCKHLVQPAHIFDHVLFISCFWTPSLQQQLESISSSIGFVRMWWWGLLLLLLSSVFFILYATAAALWQLLSAPAEAVIPELKQFCERRYAVPASNCAFGNLFIAARGELQQDTN